MRVVAEGLFLNYVLPTFMEEDEDPSFPLVNLSNGSFDPCFADSFTGVKNLCSMASFAVTRF